VYYGLQLDAVRISSVDGDDFVVLVEVRDDDRADVAERLLVDRTVLLRTLLVHLHAQPQWRRQDFVTGGK